MVLSGGSKSSIFLYLETIKSNFQLINFNLVLILAPLFLYHAIFWVLYVCYTVQLNINS